MESPVVLGVAEALVGAGWAALRFNFGGVGDSEGTRGAGLEEQCDVGAAEAALRERVPAGIPIAIVGYSFGAWVGAMAARGLPHVARVVAIGPPLGFYDWGFARALPQTVAVVVGDRDGFCPLDALRRLEATRPIASTVLAGADHFFAGRGAEVGRAVLRHLET
jgi:alpha/beta superfamily hydrolase